MASWYILRAATRQEKKASAALQELKIDHYLPMETVDRIINKERGPVERPLFPGYLFALIEDADFHAAIHANYVHAPVTYTRNSGERAPRSVPWSLIVALQAMEANGEFDRTTKEPEPRDMETGDSLRILAGPLAGRIGAMLEVRGSERIALLLNSATVEIDRTDLEFAA